MRKALFVLVFAALVFIPQRSFAQDTLDVAHHFDLPQVSIEVLRSPRETHLILGGYSLSLLRAGNLRFPRLGIDWQYRNRQGSHCDCQDDATGHWFAVGGASYVLSEGWNSDEWDLIFGTSFDLRGDRLRNRFAVNVGVSYVFSKTQ